jgi:hypothetical protein
LFESALREGEANHLQDRFGLVVAELCLAAGVSVSGDFARHRRELPSSRPPVTRMTSGPSRSGRRRSWSRRLTSCDPCEQLSGTITDYPCCGLITSGIVRQPGPKVDPAVLVDLTEVVEMLNIPGEFDRAQA